MSSRLKAALLAAGLLLAAGVAVWGQAPPGTTTSSVNPAPGSLWTYLGPTLGADWTTPPGVSNAAQPAHWFYAGPTSGANAVPTFRPMANGDIPSGITIDSPNLTGNPVSVTPPIGDNDTSIATTAFVTNKVGANTNCPNILAYGGQRDGTTDNVPAWAAITAVSRCIYFPPGAYSFSAQISYTLSANGQVLTVIGDAPDTTSLLWPAGGGLKIVGTAQKTAFHIHGLSFLTRAVNTGIAIDAEWGSLHNSAVASSTISRTRVSGETIGSNYWATGIMLNGISQVNMDGLDVWGQEPGENVTPTQSVGLDIEASAANLTFIFNIVNSSFFGALYGLKYGPGVQGVQAANANFTNNAYGVYVTPSSFSAAQAQLSITNSQFDNQTQSVLVDAGSTLSHLMLVDNVFYVRNGGGGVDIRGGGQHTIVSNHFTTVATPYVMKGILIENGDLGIIANNICISLLTCVELNYITALGQWPNHWQIKGNMIDGGNAAQRVVVNNAPENSPNYITGFNDPDHLFFPNALTITAAANSGGLIQLTTGQDTKSLVRDQIVMVTAPGLANQPGMYRIGSIPDAHTVILAGSAFASATGGMTDNGMLSVVP